MPTYDYECTKCGHVFEMFQSITAPAKKRPDEPCASCGQRAPIRRLIGGGGAVLFKGSGFYETDYRSEGYKKAAKAEKDSSAKPSESSTPATSDPSAAAKPAPAPEKKSKDTKKSKGSGK